MAIQICPRCQQRYCVSSDTTDYVHQCNSGNLALDQEDVPLTDSWTDYDGTGTKDNLMMVAGLQQKSVYSKAYYRGARPKNASRRGNNANITRTRSHQEYINLKND